MTATAMSMYIHIVYIHSVFAGEAQTSPPLEIHDGFGFQHP